MDVFYFQDIKQQAKDFKDKEPALSGARESNKKKNRYKDILPCKVLISVRFVVYPFQQEFCVWLSNSPREINVLELCFQVLFYWKFSVWIKRIVIMKCDLFFHYCNAEETHFTIENSIYIAGIMFVR